MKHIWQAGKPALVMLLVLSIGLLVTALPIVSGFGGQLVPPPETVAEQFVGGISSRWISGAMNTLSTDLQGQITPDILRQIEEAIGRAHGGIDDSRGTGAQIRGDQATATVRVKLNDQQQADLVFPLALEKHLWKLTSIEPIYRLAE